MQKHKHQEVQIFQCPPPGFDTKAQVASTYVSVDGKLLLLQLSHLKQESGCWGIPAGKIEANESPENAARRELYEETGISIDSKSHMQSLGCIYVRKPNVDFVYHMFKIELPQIPKINLSEEHQSYAWMNPQETNKMPLMAGEKDALRFYVAAHSPNMKRSATSINAYLILRKDDEVLLMLRKNTGYGDGFYGLVSGHVEDGEPATTGMIREAREEAGIELDPSQLKMVHVMHTRTNRQNIDFFFECTSWKGDITNMEPDKCDGLEFFPLHRLPHNIIVQVAQALRCVARGEYYSELGWDTP